MAHLNLLGTGEVRVVQDLNGGRGFVSRVVALGFTPGTEVMMLQNFRHFSYILIGSFYTTVKLIYHFVSDFAGPRAVVYGIITGGLTVCAGILAVKEFNKKHKSASKHVGHWLAILLPLIIIPLTPLTMQREQGVQWLLGDRLIILMIFEIIAITQVILAISMVRGLMRERDKSIEP